MNLLIFDREELAGDHLVLTGRRAEHLLKVLGVKPGRKIRVGEVNGQMGQAEVVKTSESTVSLQVQLDTLPEKGVDVELILALPRPIMLQRILKNATVLGVRKFHLIRSRKVEKSFFQSPVLGEEKIRSLLLEGMEQACDTHLPEVTLYRQFKPFLEDIVPSLSGKGIIAHPDARGTLPQVYQQVQPAGKVLLAIGPEGGWTDYEQDCFSQQGFAPFTMGKRILHVDTAVVALLAQVQLLEDLVNR